MMTPSETTIETAPVARKESDRFSWRRVWLIGRYMIPALRKQLILYPIVITLFTCASQMFYSIGWMQLTDAGIFSTLCGFMFYFAPCSLARRDNRFIMAQIPARTSEKFVFLLIYYWIVIGILTIGLNKALTMIMGRFMSSVSMDLEVEIVLANLTEIMGLKLTYIMITGSFAALAIQAFALYGVVTAKTSRMMTGIGYSLAGYVGMCVLSGIIGAVMGFLGLWKMKSGVNAGMDPDEIAVQLVSQLLPSILTIVTVILCIIACMLLCKTYKIIRHRGF
ncbi:MAG: hypothetical protein K2K05_06495 [Muribaculaceae bacterium]|nr:hypothetical protein [Muribaculaceae bacterium]